MSKGEVGQSQATNDQQDRANCRVGPHRPIDGNTDCRQNDGDTNPPGHSFDEKLRAQALTHRIQSGLDCLSAIRQ